MLISIKEFAKRAGVTSTTIGKRIKSRHLFITATIEDGRMKIRIDTTLYDPKLYGERKRGRPRKAKIEQI